MDCGTREGSVMKPKRLTIIFFSIMMLAATPRAMSHFNNYADNLHQKVEEEWLSFLLEFAAPIGIEDKAATERALQQPEICSTSTSDAVERAAIKLRADAKEIRDSIVSKVSPVKVELTGLVTESSDIASEHRPDDRRIKRNARWRIEHAPEIPAIPVEVDDNELAKAARLWTLTQATLSGKNKAARALVRELTALSIEKSRESCAFPVCLERVILQRYEQDSTVADRERTSRNISSDESMR